uniref:Neurotransmitter-gated ion-channel transmembrane domain-containing protein n=1 Tax=Strigamia maritima TaxID=126957 RepID=T1JK80_STRMM
MVAPRVSLGLTSMLTLVTHFTSAIRELPAVPTVMAIDIWSDICLILVFSSITAQILKRGVHRLDELFLNDYNMYEPPPKVIYGEYKNIDVYFHPMTILSLSPKNMEFTLDSFLASSWIEPRYNYTLLNSLTRDRLFRFPKHLVAKMWLPALYIENCKGCADLLLSDSDHVNVYYDQMEKTTIAWIRWI